MSPCHPSQVSKTASQTGTRDFVHGEPQVPIYRCWLTLLLIALGAFSSGCRPALKTGYGRAYGSDYSTSVNGTVVFQEMVRSAGHGIERYRKISPRWEQHQTVVWFPDGFGPPSSDAIERMENWLASGKERTLVFVARDFDAEMVYWDRLRQHTAEATAGEFEREYADAATRYLGSKNYLETKNCDWYEMFQHPFGPAENLDGELARGIDPAAADVRFGALPVPGDVKSNGQYGDYHAEVLLTVDEFPMVYSLERDAWPGSRIIIVGNGTFLLNLPLANEQNRFLASNLIEKIDEYEYAGDAVLFIESTDEIAISDHDSPEAFSKWSWITRKPLRYIVPNVLFCCLLLCFVYFPIFGRPRKIKRNSTANFRDHIQALGQLIQKTKRRDSSQSWIDEYRRRNSNAQHLRSDKKTAD